MALQISLTREQTSVRVSAPVAYARIAQFLFNADTNAVEVAVNVWADAEAAARPEPGKPPAAAPITGGVYRGVVGVDLPTLDDTIPGVRAALYGWLKTFPLFAGATDV